MTDSRVTPRTAHDSTMGNPPAPIHSHLFACSDPTCAIPPYRLAAQEAHAVGPDGLRARIEMADLLMEHVFDHRGNCACGKARQLDGREVALHLADAILATPAEAQPRRPEPPHRHRIHAHEAGEACEAEARPPEGLDADRLAAAIRRVAPQRMWPVRGVHEIATIEFAERVAAEYARLPAEGAPE